MRRAASASLFLLALIAGQAGAISTQTVIQRLALVADPDVATVAYDINAKGQVAAVLEDDDGRRHGVLYEKGRLWELGTLGGAYSETRAINSKGEIAGAAQDAGGRWRAFRYDRKGGMIDLGTLGGSGSFATAINEAGDVAGYADDFIDDFRAFVYRNGVMTDLGTLGGKVSYAAGINNAGQVVGTAATESGYRHAFLHDPVRGMIDLGTLGGRQSSAAAVNDAGVVVGSAQAANGRWHAFIHDGTRMVDLGALVGYGASFATDINNAGHVVGTVLIRDERRSFVWRDGKMTVHRGGKGLHLTNSINEAEQVVGATYDRKLFAATMASSAVPVTDHGGSKFVLIISIALGAAALLVVYRRRFHGIALGGNAA